jgi:hypothetical protein
MLNLDYRLGASENSKLRRMSGCMREGLKGGWRNLHKEKLHIMYPSPITIKSSTVR